MRWLLLALVAAVLALGLYVALKPGMGRTPGPGGVNMPLRVCATIAPLAEWLREVAGPDAEVHLLCAGLSNPHHFEPGPRDVTAVSQSRAVFSVGLGLDEWAVRLVENAGGSTMQLFETGDWIKPRKLNVTTIETKPKDFYAAPKKEGAGDHAGHDHHGHHHHGDEDPHFWLDPYRARIVVQRMADELGRLSPAHAAVFQRRAKEYNMKLNALDAQIKLVAKYSTGNRKLVTFHDAYGYLFERLNMNLVGVVQVSPGVEPGTRDFSTAIATMKEIGQKTVFSEPAGNPKIAQMLAVEIGGSVALLDPLDTEHSEAGKTYIERMTHNLRTLSPQVFTNPPSAGDVSNETKAGVAQP